MTSKRDEQRELLALAEKACAYAKERGAQEASASASAPMPQPRSTRLRASKARRRAARCRATARRVAMFKGPWVIGGDFNGTADELRKTGWLEVVKGTIIQPSGKTCSRGGGRTLDFFVVSNCLVPHVVGA